MPVLLLGTEDDWPSAFTEILRRLGFEATGSGPWTVSVPSWRGDVAGEADLVEALKRMKAFIEA